MKSRLCTYIFLFRFIGTENKCIKGKKERGEADTDQKFHTQSLNHLDSIKHVCIRTEGFERVKTLPAREKKY